MFPETRRRDADNCEGMLVQANGSSNHTPIALETNLPIGIREHDIWSTIRPVLIRCPEKASQRHQGDVAIAVPLPTVSVVTARIGFIASQLTVAGVHGCCLGTGYKLSLYKSLRGDGSTPAKLSTRASDVAQSDLQMRLDHAGRRTTGTPQPDKWPRSRTGAWSAWRPSFERHRFRTSR
jgi:hypothetical protein